jgi:hypothetical protein
VACVAAAEYETEPVELFLIAVWETEKLWSSLLCPKATCGQERIDRHDHTVPRKCRHLDAFGKRPELLYALLRARC